MSGWEPVWISLLMVETMHTALVREFGGPYGIRDKGALQSALARPQNKWAYGERDLHALAAAYGFGLCKNHGFIDGNKRIAFVVMAVFLHRNGLELEASEEDAVVTMLSLATGELDEEGLTEWLQQNTRPI